MLDTENNQTFDQIQRIILHSMKTQFQRSIQSLSWLKGVVSWCHDEKKTWYISECNGLSKNKGKKCSKWFLIKHYKVKKIATKDAYACIQIFTIRSVTNI